MDRQCPSNNVMNQADDWPVWTEGTLPYHQRIYQMMEKLE